MKYDSHYYTFRQYLETHFGKRVWKVPVNAPFTCPNRDGTKGRDGCIYCNNNAFSPTLQLTATSIHQQIAEGIKRVQRKRNVKHFLVYFQSYSNTYADLPVLKAYYDEALAFEEVVGLAVGTRPDCISEPVLDLLESYAKRAEIWIEYGLQSIHDTTLKLINRGHNFADFEKAIEMTQNRQIQICVHVIIGLPGETRADILATARKIAEMPIHSIKIHPLQVHPQTELAKMYAAGDIHLMSLSEYVSICCDFLELLPKDVVVQRLTADAPEDFLIAPDWCLNKLVVLQTIDKEFVRRGSFQGKKNAQLNKKQ
ncbi:TIGR01212 family radical SAM protein [bacterium]|nr:TIGR01212 family radical SAM protein [bacterium]